MTGQRWWACHLGHRNEIPDERDKPYPATCTTCRQHPPPFYYRIEPTEPVDQ